MYKATGTYDHVYCIKLYLLFVLYQKTPISFADTFSVTHLLWLVFGWLPRPTPRENFAPNELVLRPGLLRLLPKLSHSAAHSGDGCGRCCCYCSDVWCCWEGLKLPSLQAFGEVLTAIMLGYKATNHDKND